MKEIDRRVFLKISAVGVITALGVQAETSRAQDGDPTEINYIDADENPHLAYGITEEEYRDTKETVENLIPTEFRSLVLEQADGYSHEHWAFVKKENGEISYWRPGMGNNLEDGWVQVLDILKIPELNLLAYLEGNREDLKKRVDRGQDDLSVTRFNRDQDFINNLVTVFKDHDRYREGNISHP